MKRSGARPSGSASRTRCRSYRPRYPRSDSAASLPSPTFSRALLICALMQRILYLVAYDISHPRRLARALKTVRAYATGGQKSVHECWLLPGELATLKRDLEAVIDAGEDSALFVRLDPRLKP